MSLDDESLSSLIREHATRHGAPDALRAGIRTQMALADAGRSEPPSTVATVRPPGYAFAFSWRTACVSFALGLGCAWMVLPHLQRIDLNDPVDAELVADHVRAMQADKLTAVASADRHTVKPWFQGRIDYAPPVIDLAAHGFPLLGGRTEQVRGSVVAALVYTRNRHFIDVFVWPSAEQRTPGNLVRRGFNVVHWADGSMQYWAVSDLERKELERFTTQWLAQAAKR